ncbi:U3 small nucleolar RNA-associated protein 15 [Capsaspora owczarzaki ATCC 30864]|uniref:U3 small nucleolar RNA-associated protein 15 n=1 Tax=Capsaspora owczarzaki (strain ATCC 30864) TaxID=595528 RepID=A0A0D2UI43_CAPO3|nr:U3 small nucleolar RNA-associated protein 15 [Capsaspora owczarzaki ATCC 30864]KJE94791.1 U3 small nucleolar RNA-associated protein 15 [Capsaspora owczarzaki ATCC 30864]KJE94792.1 U3 small nucleolar RNA-associated protein 15, variant 1 [Capsaspora owczarzaki ATCC 30864]KJE94793.1 U3 small nucleolar RNA-associated protein 15, variant 2 [Capsaspora owczarzaki ATCC 30864]KJE94794.1 U3 small nucleolar RNA-associated protein 15, variant 3 [Capsaspora owczarzaki ATCC 30864]|eukprot:XP_004347059.2 U3 small nucleolar RNA-associated protein 15 [Capsaspora owczarzaki ATCC 30864]
MMDSSVMAESASAAVLMAASEAAVGSGSGFTNAFPGVTTKQYPRLARRETSESRYWKRFKFPVVVKEYSAVSHIHFSPTAPWDFAVTSSTRIQIYSKKSNTVKKTLSRFKDVAYCGTFRRDGKLLVAGDESGLVQLLDPNSRSVLRTFAGHQRAVHVTRFATDDNQIMSAGDDAVVRCWDIPAERQVLALTGHTDYIRAGVVSPVASDVWLTGGYDHMVKLWDTRAGSCTMSMNHGAPVEQILFFPGGGLALSAGSNQIKVWDVLAGGRLLQTFSNHQKTITSMCLDSQGKRLLTASLDQHVKIHDVTDYSVTHSIKYTAPILSMSLSPDDTHLVVGMANGLLSIRHRAVKTAEVVRQLKSERAVRGGTYRYFVRGKTHQPSQDDFKVEVRRKRRLKPFEVFLKKFQYQNALDAVLNTGQRPIIVISLLEELVHRDGLRIALAGRDEITLEPLIVFLIKNIANPRYSSLLIDLSNMLFDIYTPALGQSIVIDELFVKLQRVIATEIAFQKQLYQLIGSLDMILSSSQS